MTLSPIVVQAWHRIPRWLALALLGVALIALFPLQALAQNTPPVIQVNAGLTLSEGSMSTIGPSLLSVSDAEQGASQLTFTVVTGPANGSLSLGTGFTQADIDNNLVTYTHDGGETTLDYFTFMVSDGAGGTISTTPFVITITPENDAPTLAVNTGLSLDEGDAATIGAGALEVTDVDNTPAQLTFTLTTAPVNGALLLSGGPLSVASTFTQADVNAGVLSYSHDGGETLTDSFVFSFSDGDITNTGNSFGITITAVNDGPILVFNNGLAVNEEDAGVVIDDGDLLVTDAEQGAGSLTYTVVSGPNNGWLSLSTGFTQADVNAGSLTYTHDGGESLSDYFTFAVSDGAGGIIATTPFIITVTPVNDAPTLAVNSGLSLNEGAAATIGAGVLEVTDVDNTPAQLTYTVTATPVAGMLLLSGSPLSVASTFTQADVNSGLLSYSHDGGETLTDAFMFSFSDGEITVTGSAFGVTITEVNDSPILAVNNGLAVNEGDAGAVIDDGDLLVTDAEQGAGSLTYTVEAGPNNGWLSPGTGFTQGQVNAGSLTYTHDGGESLSDNFRFTVSDGVGGTVSSTFVITITPVDDAPALVVNDSLSVVRGGSEIITRGQLYADDVDTAPTDILFAVTAPPAVGTLVLNGLPGPSTFTQDDIDYGRLRYDHDGSSSTLDGFSFELSDLTTTIGPYDFVIKVLGPSADPPAIASIVDVGNDQGRSVLITFEKCGADTAGSPTPVLEYGAFRRIDPLSAAKSRTVDRAPSLEGWTFVGSVPANGESTYSIVAPTLADSTVGGGIHWSVFFMRALTAEPTVYFDSTPDSGYSVDNLAPGVPMGFAVAYNTGSGNALTWEESIDEDFQYFRIYRSTDPNFVPSPGDLIATIADVNWSDPGYDGWTVHYKITAVDFAGNESDAASAGTVTGAQDKITPTAFALHQNVPNPFNPATAIRYDVPEGGGRVAVRVYDVTGRLIRTLIDADQTAGTKRVVWRGLDERGTRVASGVYLYRMTAPGFEMTRKMVLLQ